MACGLLLCNVNTDQDGDFLIYVGDGGVSWQFFSHIDHIFYADYLYSTNEIVFCR